MHPMCNQQHRRQIIQYLRRKARFQANNMRYKTCSGTRICAAFQQPKRLLQIKRQWWCPGEIVQVLSVLVRLQIAPTGTNIQSCEPHGKGSPNDYNTFLRRRATWVALTTNCSTWLFHAAKAKPRKSTRPTPWQLAFLAYLLWSSERTSSQQVPANALLHYHNITML